MQESFYFSNPSSLNFQFYQVTISSLIFPSVVTCSDPITFSTRAGFSLNFCLLWYCQHQEETLAETKNLQRPPRNIYTWTLWFLIKNGRSSHNKKFSLLSDTTCRELEGIYNSQDINQCLNGILADARWGLRHQAIAPGPGLAINNK